MTKKSWLVLSFFLTISAATLFLSGTMTDVDPGTAYGIEPTVLYSWDFDNDGDTMGWTGNCIKPLEAKDGCLNGTCISWDPFVISPQMNLKPKAGQVIEIRMKSSGVGRGEFFMASTNEGQYAGFNPQKVLPWDLIHDNEFHTYQIIPNWLDEPQIVKFRLDVGNPGNNPKDFKIAIDYIRILDLNIDQAEEMESYSWDKTQLDTLKFNGRDGQFEWRSEVFALDARKAGGWLQLEWTNDGSIGDFPYPMAAFRFLGDQGTGTVLLNIPLPVAKNASKEHPQRFRRDINLLAYKEWIGTIYRWEIVLPKGCGLQSLGFADAPSGPGMLENYVVGPTKPILRLTKDGQCAFEYEVIAKNVGGRAIDSLSCVFHSDCPDIQLNRVIVKPSAESVDSTELVVEEGGNTVELPSIDAQKSHVFFFVFKAGSAAAYTGTLSFSGKCCETGEAAELETIPVAINVLPYLELPEADYVPEPQPVQSEYEIGALYFPGWSNRAAWDRIDVADPIRKPVLGWYDEGNSEVVDWQIKWAAESGIQFFLVDWYWKHGKISLEHWIKAFQKAKYRSHLKWAMMWANHTGPGTHSEEDQRKVTQYWLDNYFNTPEYYTIDGKPVVMIWDASIMDNDIIAIEKQKGNNLKKGDGVKKLLDLSRQMCIDAGYPGIYFIAMKWPEASPAANHVQWLADGGFDCTSLYHFMDSGNRASDNVFPFDYVVDATPEFWNARQETGILPFLPNLSTGWDSRPWHGFKSTVIYGRTPEKFRKICEDFKEFSQKTGIKRAVIAPLNEWGEGSYMEPNLEFGFRMYETLRETLCIEPEGGFPAFYAPSDVGLGPYDFPPKDPEAEK